MSLLKARIRDRRLLDLIWRFLRAGVMEGGLFNKTETGTPQGGVLSPLLANIYLNHFDRWFADRAMLGQKYQREKNRKAGHANFLMVRYADDFVVFSNGTKEETVAFKEEMRAWLARELHLTLSEEKTAITHFRDGFDFLGFTFKKTEARSSGRECVVSYPSTASVQRAVRRVAEITDRSHIHKSREDVILALNTFLRGWGEYFRHSSAKRALAYIGSRAHMRMWAWLVNKDYGNTRRGWRATKAKYHHKNTWRVGKHHLLVLATMRVTYPRHRILPHPYLGGPSVVEPWHRDPFRSHWDGYQNYGSDWRPAMEAAAERAGDACVICGATDDVEFHHIKARRRGGGNSPANLVPLCVRCHRQAERRNSEVSHRLHQTPT